MKQDLYKKYILLASVSKYINFLCIDKKSIRIIFCLACFVVGTYNRLFMACFFFFFLKAITQNKKNVSGEAVSF